MPKRPLKWPKLPRVDSFRVNHIILVASATLAALILSKILDAWR